MSYSNIFVVMVFVWWWFESRQGWAAEVWWSPDLEAGQLTYSAQIPDFRTFDLFDDREYQHPPSIIGIAGLSGTATCLKCNWQLAIALAARVCEEDADAELNLISPGLRTAYIPKLASP